MTDEELLSAEREARLKAWQAPKHGDAYARFGSEWAELHAECRRRGLSPSTDDPTFKPKSTERDE